MICIESTLMRLQILASLLIRLHWFGQPHRVLIWDPCYNPLSYLNDLVMAVNANTVQESCIKETIPCVLSPLGFHLTVSVKEKIWKNDFFDVLTLLPPKDKKSEDEKRKPVAKTFANRLQGFCIYPSVLCERYPEKKFWYQDRYRYYTRSV